MAENDMDGRIAKLEEANLVNKWLVLGLTLGALALVFALVMVILKYNGLVDKFMECSKQLIGANLRL